MVTFCYTFSVFPITQYPTHSLRYPSSCSQRFLLPTEKFSKAIIIYNLTDCIVFLTFLSVFYYKLGFIYI